MEDRGTHATMSMSQEIGCMVAMDGKHVRLHASIDLLPKDILSQHLLAALTELILDNCDLLAVGPTQNVVYERGLSSTQKASHHSDRNFAVIGGGHIDRVERDSRGISSSEIMFALQPHFSASPSNNLGSGHLGMLSLSLSIVYRYAVMRDMHAV